MQLAEARIRLPADMRDRIQQRAEQNRRSMNAEIVYYLDRALAEEARGPAGAATPPGQGHSNPLEGNADEHGNA